MKKIIISILLLVNIANAFSQQTTTQEKNKDYYLEKSRSKKTTAWILLGAGTAAAIAGGIGFDQNFDPFGSSSGADAYGFLLLGGVAADIVSIPFFVSATHYKRLAADVTINNQSIYLPKQNTIALSKIPALTVKIHF